MRAARTLSLAGTEIIRIGLGSNRLTHTAESVSFVKAAVEAGIQMIDTAHVYTGGGSERTMGAALSPAPAVCVVATKGGMGGPGAGRPEVLRAEIEESLRRLRADGIFFYYLHRVDPQTPIEESVTLIKEYVDRGLIQNVGVSQVTVEQVERARAVLPIAAVQNEYSLAERKSEAVVDYCEREGIVFVPFYPLRGGDGTALEEIARRHGATPSQVRLAWLLYRSPAMLPIPGTLSRDHLKDNLGALEIELASEEFEALRGGAQPSSYSPSPTSPP
ncbi:MAG: aldo/keto reductase [Candidatus Dormibacterales bacterium]